MIDLNELKKSKVFCMAPWIHLYALPSGDAFPCCLNDTKLGNLNNDKISDLINSSYIKELRLKMLSETEPAECYRCLNQPLNNATHRKYLNNRYLDKHSDIIKSTSKTGQVDNFKFAYWDFRFSNYCNMKCRMCGPEYSTKWYEDIEKKLQIQKISKDFDLFLKQIEPYIDQMFDLLGKTYDSLQTFVPIQDYQIKYYKDKYLKYINPGFIKTPLTDKNKFPMPFLKDSKYAADKIYYGLVKKKKFELMFPLPWFFIMKFLRLLPYKLYFYIVSKGTGI